MNIYQVGALPNIESQVVALDIETTMHKAGESDPYRDRIVSAQASDGESVWILKNNFMSLAPLLANPSIKKVGHNLSFDLKFLKQHIGVMGTNIYDTLLCERVLTSGMDLTNDYAAVLFRYTGEYIDKSIRSNFTHHRGAFTAEQLEYMAKDVYYLPKIREEQLKKAAATGVGKVFKLENAVVPIVAQMELDGVGFDRELWKSHTTWMENEVEQIQRKVAHYLRIPHAEGLFGGITIGINLGSTDQVRKMLDDLEVYVDSTKEEYLVEELHKLDRESPAHRFISDVLEYRHWDKLIGMGYDKYVNPVTGNIHSSWNQIQAETGRFSSSRPNLQNITSPKEGEPNLRHCFIPPAGWVVAGADFTQQEPKIWADLSGDVDLISVCSGEDVYLSMGESIYNRKLEKKGPERAGLKITVLADMYGRGTKSLGEQIGSEEKAIEFKQMLRRRFPQGYRYMDDLSKQALSKGFVATALGRRRHFPTLDRSSSEYGWKSGRISRQAQNMPIQGTAADISKEAMRRYEEWRVAKGYEEARIRLVVHDEIQVYCPPEQAESVLDGLETAMKEAMAAICPKVTPGAEGKISERWEKA